jgi:putative ABC transport system substrate-binding protein
MKRVAVLLLLDINPEEDAEVLKRYVDNLFMKPLAELGWREGVNIKVVTHVVPLQSDYDESVPRAVASIANGKYDGAFVEGEILTRRLHQAARGLPIVAYLFDPVGQGFAQTLAKPGGMITGAHRGVREVFLKQMDILRRIVPQTTRMGWISFPPQLELAWAAFDSAAKAAGLTVKQVLLKHEGGQFPALAGDFEAMRREGYRCAHFMGGIELDIKAVCALALRHRIAISFWGSPSELEREGLLIQYRSEREGVEARLCAAMARVLRGHHPRDIPFEGPTKYQLRINLKTAARIGVKVPDDVLVMMDEIIR